jgi:LPXTG-site transpeptidase (sortase) family protein
VAALGLVLLATPEIREVAGRWSQWRLAVEADARGLGYRSALRTAYAVPVRPGPDDAPVVRRWAPPAPDLAGLRIAVPSIGLDQVVMPDVTRKALRAGPGHYPGTALPGAPGVVVISGHRSTFTMPFRDLDRLAPADVVALVTPVWTYRYRVEDVRVVAPTDLRPVRRDDGRLLVLTTCDPPGSAAMRLVVVARLLPAFEAV